MALLSAESIVVRFGGVHALADASIEVESSTVTGLIGPNGAGKTTFFNVITGLQRPARGEVLFDGDDITGRSPYRRARMGIARTFQKLEAFSSLSARHNILVAAEQRRARDRRERSPARVADELLARVGLEDVADFMVGTLPTGTARLVELARALATGPKLLLLDEPSSGLDDNETGAMAALLRDLVSDGLAVLLVEHDMSFVMGTCDTITVLDFGRVISSGTPEQVGADPLVQTAYLGTLAES